MAILSCKERSQELLYLNIWPINSKGTIENKIEFVMNSLDIQSSILEMGYESLKLGISRII